MNIKELLKEYTVEEKNIMVQNKLSFYVGCQ